MNDKEIERIMAIGRQVRLDIQKAELLPKDLVLKDKYPIECPYCKETMSFAPSVLMELGANMGGGLCPECDRHFNIRIDTRDNTGLAFCLQVPGVLQ